MITAEQARALTEKRTLKYYLDEIDKGITAQATAGYDFFIIVVPINLHDDVFVNMPMNFKLSQVKENPSQIIIKW